MSANPLLQQFIQEARDFLQGIGEKLMALESQPDNLELMTELFRLVHTLKGNSGLFEFPDMTKVLHASEDLMDAVRDGRIAYSRQIADTLLDAMDMVSAQIDEIEATGNLDAANSEPAQEQVRALRALIPAQVDLIETGQTVSSETLPERPPTPPLTELTEAERMAIWQAAGPDVPLYRVLYYPEAECFFKGEDPFYQARHIPGLAWGKARARAAWPPLAELDCYRCELSFDTLVRASHESLVEYFRYVPEQVVIGELPLIALALPQGQPNGGPVYGDFVAEALDLLDRGDLDGLRAAIDVLLEISAPDLWLCSALRWLKLLVDTDPKQKRAMRKLIESLNTLTAPDWQPEDWISAARSAESQPQATLAAETIASVSAKSAPTVKAAVPPPLDEADQAMIEAILDAQGKVLALPDGVEWLPGRLKACATTLRALLSHRGEVTEELDEALADALAENSSRPLANWLAHYRTPKAMVVPEADAAESMAPPAPGAVPPAPTFAPATAPIAVKPSSPPAGGEGRRTDRRGDETGEIKFGRRAEDAQVGKILKVDQVKVDRLMNLIGEMVVAKNSLPYLAKRAEDEFHVRELAREIKSQYAVINRIVEEMQDAIMQVRMMPVSFVFQRFPRLVRDISRKLGKEVELVLEGEDTEADKNIVEALADPLIHIVRNSLDHGLETADVRVAAGKPAVGKLIIRAQQESDRVLIEVIDDGKGIDPAVIKRKAYEKGVIDEAQLDKISDQEAQNLVFAAGFSTAEQVSDLSGRGVGLDVVRNALDKVGGTVNLTSSVGKGTTLRLTLPLSMAVSKVMIVESDRQIFGVPMEMVVETVRLPRSAVRTIKRRKTAVLRGKIVPLVSLNELLAIDAEPQPNADDELAVLVVKVGSEQVGLLVDEFNEVVDVILKPLPGELARLTCYAGTALLGDGSVLMVINPKELF